jgi:hypothetical protein
MNVLQDRRMLAAIGAALAVVAGVAIATVFSARDRNAPSPAVATRSGLTVEMTEAAKIDPARELRCFVGGQLVGSLTLAECAERNGVAAQSLDVGLDESGALAAGSTPLQPLADAVGPAPAAAIPEPAPQPDAPPSSAQANAGECLRYGADGWRPVGGGALTLNACVQQLFDGRCQRPGEGVYGRWGAQTLRLAGARVESSTNNRDFATLVEQGANCALPPL